MKAKFTKFKRFTMGTVQDIGLSLAIQMLCPFLLGHIVIIVLNEYDEISIFNHLISTRLLSPHIEIFISVASPEKVCNARASEYIADTLHIKS